MSLRLPAISRREYKMGLKSAILFKGIVNGDLAMINHISGEVPRDSLYYFAGKDVANIMDLRNSVHSKNLQENLLHSQNHIRLRQFILAGELTQHHGIFKATMNLPRFPEWLKKEAKKILIDYAIGTYGAVKHGQAEISELYNKDFYQHIKGIIDDVAQLWKPKELLSSNIGDDGKMGRNALYDLLLTRQERFIGAYGAIN